MPLLHKPSRPSLSGKDAESSEMISSSLWVGNLSIEVTELDLMGLFAKYGALDSIISYSARSYAFVYFKHVEGAKVAKDALQGTVVRGIPIKIEFARPAKPSKILWVGGISQSVSKEQLEGEFLKFGKIEDFKFFRDRNTAYVDYFRVEDASQAMKNMNMKHIGSDQIRVDFLRSQPSRREQWSGFHDTRDGQLFNRNMGPPGSPWVSQDFSRNYSEPTHSGSKRPQPSQSSGVRKLEGQPSNVLWIGYPPSLQIDEQMLHNAMILFGEIERIKSFPSRHYSFVEFRSVDEARRAKEGLQGRLFNDPRISIMFSSSDFAPGKDYGFYPGIKGPRPDMFVNELPFRPTQMDIFGNNRPVVPNSFPGPLPPSGMPGANMLTRPFGPQGGFDPLLPGPEFNDLANHSSLMGPNWRRPSPPAPGILPPPASGIRPIVRPKLPGPWDVLDANQFQRESKRSRIDGPLLIDDASYPPRKVENQGFGLDQSYGLGTQLETGVLGPPANVQGKNNFSPADARVIAGGLGRGRPDNDYIWRGIIAKGGTPVCNARCVPLGKGLESELSEVVNCSARTGLELLTKHYAEAIGFEIVFFLPDSEEDFASYTEFLQYLGSKNRAGVAKLDDGTTLFLVPPSEFLTNVLNVSGPERLYGVVLKMPQEAPSSSSTQQQMPNSIPSSQYVGRQQAPPSQIDYSLVPQKHEQTPRLDYNGVLPVEPKVPPKPHLPPASENSTVLPAPHEYSSTNTAAVSQSGVALTPELIATLASLLPANAQSSESGHAPLGSSTLRPSFAASVTPDKGSLPQGWKQECEAPEQTVHPSQQLGNQFNPQSHFPPQFQTYPTVSNTSSHSAQVVLGSTQMQDSGFNLPPSGALTSRPSPNLTNSSQNGQFAALPPANQPGYGMPLGSEGAGFYGSPVFQQPKNPVPMSNHVLNNPSQAQTVMPLAPDRVNSEIPNQVPQPQSALYGAGPGTTEVEADKNQRYQSTLQFAASLLLQIQQQQQQQQSQTSTQAGQGSGNQQ
ncbi:flowering time control protein FPA isoform X2 [Malania oleifera]|uniref:flowering time control protein FPA isoform X2 n=1 Tax=Malania oleifera TaxID=397392 RepID=UPI0025ADEE4D|nr:flowering time control protein FPA isoform X2 [Malania oleifera]XP_057958064.1 flowering time control protein FPA isoform X2 [Malania oleifera]XP_057958065.1 flowering time control protein FPA isoform X2 [Malania oleifera]